MISRLLLIFTLTLSFAFAGTDTVHNLVLNAAEGKKNIDFSDYKGSALLVVNIATKCGYTGQLDGLESLYKKYKDKGFMIVGIPSNSFGGQTPEKNEEVANFCRLKYGVSFPVTEKKSFKGEDQSLEAKRLLKLADRESVAWNFEKFLFNKKGEFVKWFPSKTEPESKELESEIKKLL